MPLARAGAPVPDTVAVARTGFHMLFLLPSVAHAFCGTYVGPAGSELGNGVSQVVVARSGTQTTLTLSADVIGDVSTFGMVIPVPEVLEEGQVSLADPAWFDALNAYSTPRIVSYTCDQLYADYSSSADSGAVDEGDPAEGVEVEAAYSVGEYDIVVLSATGADGLVAWLDHNGFSLTERAAPVVQEYIDAGQYFLAARVDLDALPDSAAYLTPLQFRYQSEAFSLPIRIGTTVATAEQEVVIYALTGEGDGRVAIANYPETEIADECMLPESTTDYAAWYDAQLDSAFAAGTWLTEYAWSPSGCDPCSSDPPDREILSALGAGDTGYGGFFTRLRVRYAPEEATQDLVLYTTGSTQTDQIRYITYDHDLESSFPTCGIGTPADPGSCDETTGPPPDEDDPTDGDDLKISEADCGCATGGPGVGALLAASAGLLSVRRRRA